MGRHRSFSLVSHEDVAKILSSAPMKSCPLDPLPAKVFKRVGANLLPVLTKIVNSSLSTGEVPTVFKEAMIKPILKKANLDKELLTNHRPVSNLTFVSKLIERVVSGQLANHLEENMLSEKYQSVYRQHHSTETTLTAVLNGLLIALDQKRAVFLVLLDLSAAFDTVDHNILLERLRIGLHDVAHKWMASYLSHLHQYVSIDGSKSDSQELVRGVLQGSVLGSILFSIYTLPLGDIVKKHQMSYHLGR